MGKRLPCVMTCVQLDIDRRSVLSGDSDASRLRSECCTCNGDDDDCLSYSSVSSSEDSAPRKPSACKVHDAPTDDCASYISEIFLGKGKPPRSALSSETIHNNVTNPVSRLLLLRIHRNMHNINDRLCKMPMQRIRDCVKFCNH